VVVGAVHSALVKIPNVQPANWPEAASGRFARLIQRVPREGCQIALLGLADDLGVRLNQGRPGAALGPGAFRAALAKYGTEVDLLTGHDLSHLSICDAGDIVPATGSDAASLAETHRRVTEAVLEIHRAGMIPVCIGGGHDLTFATVRALALHAQKPIGGVNIDPHLDVRETAGSGMPFRSLIEGGHVDAARFTTLGAGRFTNSREHIEWLRAQGGTIIPLDDLGSECRFRMHTALGHAAGARADAPVFVSFDLDSLDSAIAPGVSALNPCGMSSADAASLAFAAGSDPLVQHFDLMELCPPHDVDGRTARVAAFLFMNFLTGFAQRLNPGAPEPRP